MAKVVLCKDDVSGEDGAEPFRFGIQGTTWELDLTPASQKKFWALIQVYIDKAHEVTGKVKSNGSGVDYQKIREWAAANNKPANPKGRLSSELIAEYEAAQKKPS